jgi:hypothetical protein
MGRSGKLDMKINEVRLADGERIPLRAVREAKGAGRTGVMTGAMVTSGILFFPAAPLFLFIHGKDITIPKGAEVTAYIEGDAALDPEKFANSPKVPDAPPVPASAPAPPATPPPSPAANDVEANPSK